MPSISRRQFSMSAAAAVAMSCAKARAAGVAAKQTGLKEAFADKFLIGTALSDGTLRSGAPALLEVIGREFNSITAENAMKWGRIEPRENQWRWELADRFVEFGTQHGMRLVGHTLVWHSQTPDYLFVDEDGKRISREGLSTRMEAHVQTLVDRYRGRIAIWDVVNEAIDEDEKGWRKSSWLEILGPEYVERAFRLAHEADPRAQLLYNDYNEHNPGRRKFLVEVIRDYKRRGVPIHGVGFQGHIGLDYPDLAEYERSIEAIAAEGLPVHISELDVDALPRAWEFTGAEISQLAEYSEKLNPYVDGLPPEVEQLHIARYREFFELLLKHRRHIERVTFWGTHDGESWKNNFPVRGRTNYPLLFDRDLKPKPVYDAVIELAQRAG